MGLNQVEHGGIAEVFQLIVSKVNEADEGRPASTTFAINTCLLG